MKPKLSSRKEELAPQAKNLIHHAIAIAILFVFLFGGLIIAVIGFRTHRLWLPVIGLTILLLSPLPSLLVPSGNLKWVRREWKQVALVLLLLLMLSSGAIMLGGGIATQNPEMCMPGGLLLAAVPIYVWAWRRPRRPEL
jgi:hypothetical protein